MIMVMISVIKIIIIMITVIIIILIRTGVPPADCRLCSTRGWPRTAWVLLYNEVDLVVVRVIMMFLILQGPQSLSKIA